MIKKVPLFILALLCMGMLFQLPAQADTLPVKVMTYENGELGNAQEPASGVIDTGDADALDEMEDRYDPSDALGRAYTYAMITVVDPAENAETFNIRSINASTYTLNDGTEHSFQDGDEIYIYYYPSEITLPVYWVKEDLAPVDDATMARRLGGIGSRLYELTDGEAMWWDDNEKEKTSLTIPSDHSIAISSGDGAVLWTPYTLPKKTDAADGMPLIRYEIRSEDTEGKSPVRVLTSMDVTKESKTFYLQNGAHGISVAQTEDVGDGEVVAGKDMALYIIYKGGAKNTARTVAGGIERNIAANPLPFVFVLICGIALLFILLRQNPEDPEDPE